MKKIINFLKIIIKNYLSLNIGVIKTYSMKVKKDELSFYSKRKWIEYRNFKNKYRFYKFHLADNETIILGKPKILQNFNEIINCNILKFKTNFGTYGNGGPGFFGIVLDKKDENTLVYAVFSSSSYTLFDGRVA